MKRQQITIRLDGTVAAALQEIATRRRLSQSSVIEHYLHMALMPGGQDDREAVITERIDRLQRQLEANRDDLERLTETFGMFVHVWFAHTPELAPHEKAAANRAATQRMQRFVDRLVENLNTGRSAFDGRLSPVSVEEKDFRHRAHLVSPEET